MIKFPDFWSVTFSDNDFTSQETDWKTVSAQDLSPAFCWPRPFSQVHDECTYIHKVFDKLLLFEA